MSAQSALDQVRAALNPERQFPHYVFARPWRSFLFFDSDRMFCTEYVHNVQTLLEIEGASHACIEAIAPENDVECSRFAIDAKTSWDDYRQILAPLPHGWLYDYGSSFGCASNRGRWCMYCERGAEIAVIALDEPIDTPMYAWCAATFRARPLRDALAANWTYALSFRLLEHWRVNLLKNYSTEAAGGRPL